MNLSCQRHRTIFIFFNYFSRCFYFSIAPKIDEKGKKYARMPLIEWKFIKENKLKRNVGVCYTELCRSEKSSKQRNSVSQSIFSVDAWQPYYLTFKMKSLFFFFNWMQVMSTQTRCLHTLYNADDYELS